MDVALLLILPVIGGYYFASRWNFTRYYSVREEGHRLYFRAVLYGTILFVVAYVVRWLLLKSAAYVDVEQALRGDIGQFLKADKDNPRYDAFPIAVIALYALAMGIALWWPFNLVFPRDWSLKRAVKNDDFERLIYTAVEKESPLSVTADNQKVYVGFVAKTADPARDRKTLGILPIMSGYRKANGKVEFTTYYDDVYEEIGKGELAHLTPEDFEIVLPVDKIVSANMFDTLAYEEFGRNHRKRNKR